MPVPYRDLLQGQAEAGVAAFLRILPDPDEGRYLGALFLVNALGEPLEFAYNRVEIVQRFLWRRDGLRRYAARRLASSLFEICPRVPDLLLCLAEEVGPELFTQELELSIPVARVAAETVVVGHVATEERELLNSEEHVQVFWQGRQPEPGSLERALLEHLATRGLILEPFERARVGLREVYGEKVSVDDQ
jgi:hypothetical protein